MQTAVVRFTLTDLISSLCTNISVELIEMLLSITIMQVRDHYGYSSDYFINTTRVFSLAVAVCLVCYQAASLSAIILAVHFFFISSLYRFFDIAFSKCLGHSHFRYEYSNFEMSFYV